ncbi:MAG: UDP-N-acetylmuramate dehydrogenase [Alistipes sp.]|nr:UDP-N-acetylmuramate dehydrogenase [Alistipes sp.]
MIRCYENADLSSRNSFHIRQRAKRLAEFDNTDQLPELFERWGMVRWRVLGGGNNTLFTHDYDGLIVTPCGTGVEVTGEQPYSVTVRAEAGVEWDDLVQWCVDRELWGMENLSLIPGKVGAAPVQNIGAYGVEAGDVISSVEMYVPSSGNMLTLAAEHCAFGYRDSIFKNMLKDEVVITAVTFELSRIPSPKLGYGDLLRCTQSLGGPSLQNIREAVCSIRRSKLPDTAVTGNAGSFFKNPVVKESAAEELRTKWPDMPLYPCQEEGCVKLAAGWLIDKVGMKGYRSGNVGVHEKQALVLVNLGGATGVEVLELAREVQRRVKEGFGIEIETEVNIL